MLKVNLVNIDITGRHRNALSLAYLQSFSSKYVELENEYVFRILNLQCGNDLSWNFNFHLVKIMQNEPDIIGFSCYLWSIELVLKLIQVIKKVKSDVRIILGGSEVGSVAVKLLSENPNIDVIVLGEGEKTFVELLRYYQSQMDNNLDDILGIAFRNGNDVVVNDLRPVIKELDEIPSPYTNELITSGSGKVMIETSRGCPFGCTYCDWGDRYLRYFSIDRIVSDVDYILSNFCNPTLFFLDSAININPRRGKLVLAELIQLSKKHELMNRDEVEIQFFTQIETIDEEFLDLYFDLSKLANVCALTLPFQTMNPVALKESCVHPNTNLISEKIELVKEYKSKWHIPVQGYILIGLDGDDLLGYKHTVTEMSKLMDEGLLDYYWTANIAVSRGTKMYANKEKNHLVSLETPPYHFVSNSNFDFHDWIVAHQIWRGKDFFYSLQNEYQKYFVYDDQVFGWKGLERTFSILFEIIKSSKNFILVSFFEELGEFQLTYLASRESDLHARIDSNLKESIRKFIVRIIDIYRCDDWLDQIMELLEKEVEWFNKCLKENDYETEELLNIINLKHNSIKKQLE